MTSTDKKTVEASAFNQMLIDARWPDLEEGVSEYTLAQDAWNAGKAFALRASQPKAEVAELVEALGAFVGGKCPECKGWGEVAYFGEMVSCKCSGQYLPTPSHEKVAKARALIARHKAGEA